MESMSCSNVVSIGARHKVVEDKLTDMQALFNGECCLPYRSLVDSLSGEVTE